MIEFFTSFVRFFILFISGILLPGVFWSWAFPSDINKIWHKSVVSVFFGFIFALCWSHLLSTLQLNILAVNVSGSLFFALLGYIFGVKLNKTEGAELSDTMFCGLRISIILAAVFLIFSSANHWVLGGWDPGIYTNQGIAFAQNNGFCTPVGFEHDNLSTEQLMFISKIPDEMSNSGITSYRELLPGVRLDTESGAVSELFLRNYPNLIAMLISWGNVEFGFKANVFAGIIFVLVFAVICARNFGAFYALSFIAVLLFHSMFLYHVKFPTTEMFQAALFFGFVLINSYNTNVLSLILSGFICFCAVTNRISFLGLGSIYLFFICLAKSCAGEKKRNIFYLLFAVVAGMLFGVVYDIYFCGNTIFKLHYVFRSLVLVACISVLASCVIAVFSEFFGGVINRAMHLAENDKVAYGTMSLMVLLSLLVCVWVCCSSSYLYHQIKMLLSFFGLIPGLFAFAGIYLMFFDKKVNIYVRLTAVYLLVVSVITFSNQYVANIYPWAVRRYVTYTLPLLIMSAIYLPYKLWQTKKMLFRLLALLSIVVLCASQAESVYTIFMNAEYKGIYAALNKVEEHIEDKNSVIFVDDHRFATPMIYMYGHKTVDNGLVLSKLESEKSVKDYYGLLKSLLKNNTVYFFMLKGRKPEFPFTCAISNVWTGEAVETTEIVHGRNQQEYCYKKITFQPELYLLSDLPEYKLEDSDLFIDVGAPYDFLHIKSGVYGRETSEDISVRWTSSEAEFILPLSFDVSVDYIDVNYIVKHRSVPLDHIQYILNGQLITSIQSSTNSAGVITDSLSCADAIRNINILKIQVDTFIPKEFGDMDTRELGIMLDSIELR